MTPASILRRVATMRAFLRASPSPLQWPALALLGWARGNPSSLAARMTGSARVRPSQLKGAAVTVSTRDIGQLISFEELFVERAYDMSLPPFTPDEIIDCGGHVGFFTAIARAAFPQAKLAVFEPNPSNLPWLRGNVPTVTLHEAAVSDHDGTCRFDAEVSNGGRIGGDGSGGCEVRVVDLARHLPAAPDTRLLLKMDIEGEEKRLLLHILPALPRLCFIFLETHDGPVERDKLAHALEAAGFKVTLLRERGAFSDLCAERATSTL